jgi:hypothetical protein
MEIRITDMTRFIVVVLLYGPPTYIHFLTSFRLTRRPSAHCIVMLPALETSPKCEYVVGIMPSGALHLLALSAKPSVPAVVLMHMHLRSAITMKCLGFNFRVRVL